MPLLQTNQATSTAADHLTYKKRDATNTSDALSGFSRSATASEEWSVHVTGGKIYKIKFDKNFSKKHLFTFTKKTDKINTAVAEKQKLDTNKAKTVEELTKEAHQEALLNKMTKNVNSRATIGVCAYCNHDLKKHQTGSGVPVPCKQCIADGDAGCTTFQSSYGMKRSTKGVDNALDGAATAINTCIILNCVPKGEFDKIIAKGIQKAHHEKDDEYLVTLYFGEHQLGAPVKQIDAKNHNPAQVTDYKGCKVHAKKGVVTGNTENWLVFHMDTKPENLLNAAPTDWTT